MGTMFYPSNLHGTVSAPPSKSMAQRYIILSALSDKPTEIKLGEISDDVRAVMDGVRALGAKITEDNGTLTVFPIEEVPPRADINCRESGACLRFLLPVAAALGVNARFAGDGRLPARPITELLSAMETHGISFSAHKLPFEIRGKMSGGTFSLPGNISSQFISGLLMALPVTGGRIELSTALMSGPYVGMTLDALSLFGVKVSGLNVPEQCILSPGKSVCERDWSAGAVWLCAGSLCGDITVTGLDIHSKQGDSEIIQILRKFGAQVDINVSSATAVKSTLHACTLDMTGTPDLVPLVAVVASAADGKTVINGVSRLRLKESDRLEAIINMINSLGGHAECSADSITVYGCPLQGGAVDVQSDHRMVFAAALAACTAQNEVKIKDTSFVKKSYPGFLRDYLSLGGEIREY